MAWDETPYYEKSTLQSNMKMESEDKIPQRPKTPWSDKVKKGFSSASTPSLILTWYLREDKKRQARQDNEIDINEIKAAMNGCRNRWSQAINNNPDVFKHFDQTKKYDWNELISLLGSRNAAS